MRSPRVEQAARRLARAPLASPPPHPLGPDEVRRILPHRPPFLLVDRIDGVSREGRLIEGALHLRPEDPVFAGHFPDAPVYPGVLQIEALGQLGLCLAWFLQHDDDTSPDAAAPVEARVVRVYEAVFLASVHPGDVLRLTAEVVEMDEMLATLATQARRGDTLCSGAIIEVYFV